MPVLNARKAITELEEDVSAGCHGYALMARIAEVIQSFGPPYTSVYIYMLEEGMLVLRGYEGRETDHTFIPVGKGVCGTAVATGEDQNVGDVQGRENYIACNLFTKSELVVLIRRGDEIIGQIDVDSDVLDPFTPEEVAEVKKVAEAAGEWLGKMTDDGMTG